MGAIGYNAKCVNRPLKPQIGGNVLVISITQAELIIVNFLLKFANFRFHGSSGRSKQTFPAPLSIGRP